MLEALATEGAQGLNRARVGPMPKGRAALDRSQPCCAWPCWRSQRREPGSLGGASLDRERPFPIELLIIEEPLSGVELNNAQMD